MRRINCLVITNGMEGVSRNVVFGGGASGTLFIWDLWDLAPIEPEKVDKLRKHTAPITALCLSKDSTQLISGDARGYLLSWSPNPDAPR